MVQGQRAGGAGDATAMPMRLRGTVIGALSLFRAEEDALAEADVLAAQALADIATIAILQDRAAVEADIVNEELNHALNTRMMTEQATGKSAAKSPCPWPLSLAAASTIGWLRLWASVAPSKVASPKALVTFDGPESVVELLCQPPIQLEERAFGARRSGASTTDCCR